MLVEWKEGAENQEGTDYRVSHYIGYWKDGVEDGWGKLTVDGVDFHEGIYVGSNFNMVGVGRKSFDPSEEHCDFVLK